MNIKLRDTLNFKFDFHTQYGKFQFQLILFTYSDTDFTYQIQAFINRFQVKSILL